MLMPKTRMIAEAKLFLHFNALFSKRFSRTIFLRQGFFQGAEADIQSIPHLVGVEAAMLQ